MLARYHRACGREVFFLTGVDEHGQKVQQAAAKRGVEPQAHCDELHVRFIELWQRLGIGYDRFIRTTEAGHKRAVQNVLALMWKHGYIEKRTYEGWYSTASERFFTEKDLVDGKDPDTGLPVEWISETNYFFRMSRFAKPLHDLVQTGEATWVAKVGGHEQTFSVRREGFIRPEYRGREILGFLDRQELLDLSISRPKTRLNWGIELPPFEGDPDSVNHVTYVWFDALLNYATGVGYTGSTSTPQGSPPETRPHMHWWPATAHLIGKDILTTHAVYWTTMQFALMEIAAKEGDAGLAIEPAKHLVAHGWWMVEGRKMSKSLRNVVDPQRLIDTYGADALRYFLLREMPFGEDGNFSHGAIINRINADLGNDLGNALNRAISMCEKYCGGVVPVPVGAARLAPVDLAAQHDDYRAVNFLGVLDRVWAFVRGINKFIDEAAPWTLHKEGRVDELNRVVYDMLEALRHAAVLVAPFMPQKAGEMLAQLGVGLDADPVTGVPSAFRRATIEAWGDVAKGGLRPGVKVAKGAVIFPRIEAEAVEEILREVLAHEPSREAALVALQKMFGKLKPEAAGKLIDRVYAAPVTVAAGAAGGGASGGAAGASGGADGGGEKKAKKKIPEPDGELDIATFFRVALVVGEIVGAERVAKSDKLLKLRVNLAEATGPRQILSGIGKSYEPAALIGKKVAVLANLATAKIMGHESQGMVLASGEDETALQVAILPEGSVPGARIR